MPTLSNPGARTLLDPGVQSLPSLGNPLSLTMGLGTCEVQSTSQVYGREYGFGLVWSPLPFRAQGVTRKVDGRPENPTWELCMLSLSAQRLKGVKNGFL